MQVQSSCFANPNLLFFWRSSCRRRRRILRSLIGSLSNDDGDVNERGIKAIGLDWQNNNSARASRFFVHFFAVTARPRARLRRENA